MTLAELVDNRQEIFKRPRTKRDIIRNREIIPIERFEDIVPTLESRKETQAALIYPGVEIIPTDERGNPLYYSAQNFSKRGPLIRLKTLPVQESIDKEWDPLKARIEASLSPEYQDGKRYVGWYWNDPEGYFHIVQPWMVLEGRRLEMFGLKSRNIQDKVEVIKIYHARDSRLRTVDVKVPSRGKKEKYNIRLEHLTEPDDPNRFIEWTRFNARHSCQFRDADFGFRFSKSVTYCPHIVAAHVRYSREVAKGGKTVRIVPQPFPLFTEPMLRLYLSLVYDTMKMEIDEKGKTKTRPLTFPEINPILMDGLPRYGNKHTFFVYSQTKAYKTAPPIGQRKTMVQYNWSNSAPGMKFLP